MKTIAVISAKGGVGKTTVSINIAAALRLLGKSTLVVDLDPQNAVSAYLGTNGSHGVVDLLLGGGDWRELCSRGASGVQVLAYGHSDERMREQVAHQLRRDPHLLAKRLEALHLPEDMVVLIDTPPGPSVYLPHALSIADLALLVMLSDAGSYATLPMARQLLQSYFFDRQDSLGYVCLVNQFDASKELGRDVLRCMKDNFGEKLIGHIHQDQAVAESAACRDSVLVNSPHSQACEDFLFCAGKIRNLFSPPMNAARRA